MFCRMGSLHLCSPQGQYGRGQDSPLRSCVSCDWLKACVLPLFSLPRFSLECCAVESFVSFRSHLNNAVWKMKIITDYCSEPTAHSRDRSNLDHRFSQKLLRALQPEGHFKTNAVSLTTSIFTITADFLSLNLEMISHMRAVLSEKWV